MARPLSCARAGQHLQPFQAKSLKCVGGTAGLEGASAQNARAGAPHVIGGRHQLELRLHRARPSHGDEFVAADLQIQHRNNGLLAPRALQHIGGFGESSLPIFTHPARSVSGEAESQEYATVHPAPPSKGGDGDAPSAPSTFHPPPARAGTASVMNELDGRTPGGNRLRHQSQEQPAADPIRLGPCGG